jgi:hypothetical protein
MTHDMTAPPTGSDRLADYFAQQTAGAGASSTAHGTPTAG